MIAVKEIEYKCLFWGACCLIFVTMDKLDSCHFEFHLINLGFDFEDFRLHILWRT